MKLGFDLRDRSIMRRVLRFALIAVLLGFGVNAFLSIFIDRTQLLHALGNVRVIYFAVPLLLFIASYVVDSLRVMLVVSQFKIRLSFVQAFYNSAVGGFFTNITPMTVGGQPFQIYHLSAVGVPVATATNVIMSRFVEQAMTSLCISLLFLAQISWIASTLGMASRLMYVALGISFCATMLLLLILIRPHFIGRLAMRIERTFVGRFVAKVSGAHDWAPKLHRWSHRLRTNVRTLWTEKTWVMVLDTLLGATNTLLHAYSLQFVLEGVVGQKLSFVAVLITYVILWQVVFYVPTPGASGSVEGAFALVFAGMTKALGPTIIAIFVWRIATFYLLLLFDGLVYAILGRPANSSARRLSGAA
jgi:hypothetical protein